MSLGENLRRIRLRVGMTQAQLADAAGVTQSTLSELENGTRISTKYLPELAKAMKCDISELDNRYSAGDQEANVSSDQSGWKLPQLHIGQLDDTDSIQVSVSDLRTVALQALRHGEISERAARAAARELVATLAAQPSAHVVRKLMPPNRIDPESPTPAHDDQS